MRCLGCDYDLRLLTKHRCPECGREFDPNDPNTFRSTSKRKRPHWNYPILAIVYAALAVYLWDFYRLLNAPPGGMFSGWRVALVFAALGTIFEWWLVLAWALVFYPLFVVIGILLSQMPPSISKLGQLAVSAVAIPVAIIAGTLVVLWILMLLGIV